MPTITDNKRIEEDGGKAAGVTMKILWPPPLMLFVRLWRKEMKKKNQLVTFKRLVKK